MHKSGFLKLLCIAAFFLAVSCGRAEKGEIAFDHEFAVEETSPRMEMKQSVMAEQAAPAPELQDAAVGRKLIQTAHISVSTAEVAQFAEAVQTKIDEFRGFTERSQQSNASGGVIASVDLSVKIPSQNFTAFISWLEKNGKITGKSLQTQDVTDRYYDLDARVKNREILLDTYRAYLKEAKTVRDILDVSERVNSLTYEIEQMKGSLVSLDRALSYSTVNLTIYNSAVNAPSPYSFLARLQVFGSNLARFFTSALFAVLYAVIIGTALILFAALVFYLTFGKLGLVRKLFKRLK